jgi:ATP-binding cassette, subfamily B, bacterial
VHVYYPSSSRTLDRPHRPREHNGLIIHAYLRDVGINNLRRSINDMEELVAIHAETMGIADAFDARPIDIRRGPIVFEDVTFHYGGHRAPLYNGLSVDIRSGERLGLVGRSGSGKAFVKLVQPPYDVSGGRILIDGQDIAKARQQSLRSQIAIVQLDPILSHRSLAANIAYGRPGTSMTAIEQAARLAAAHRWSLSSARPRSTALVTEAAWNRDRNSAITFCSYSKL